MVVVGPDHGSQILYHYHIILIMVIDTIVITVFTM